MTKYRVVLEELATYEVNVEAENEESAMELAEEKFIREGVAKFPCDVLERDAVSVEKLEPANQAEKDAELRRKCRNW